MAPFSIHEVLTRPHFDLIVELIWAGQYTPYMPHTAMYFPVAGYSASDYARAVAASKARMGVEFSNRNPETERWVCVVDDASGEPVGCALWHKLAGSPAPDGCPRLDFYWIEEGEVRAFSEEMFRQMMVPRCLWMGRRHGDLTNMVVHPKYRGAGVGGLLMEWGNRFLDEEGLEGLIECNEVGRRLYEKWGYMTVMKISTFVPSNKADDPMWNKLAYDYKLPETYGYIVWRPPYGQIKDGERRKPWQ